MFVSYGRYFWANPVTQVADGHCADLRSRPGDGRVARILSNSPNAVFQPWTSSAVFSPIQAPAGLKKVLSDRQRSGIAETSANYALEKAVEIAESKMEAEDSLSGGGGPGRRHGPT